MKIALAQANPVVGDIAGNLERLLTWLNDCHRRCDLLVFPELYLSGYPPRDLLSVPSFIDRLEAAVEEIVASSRQLPDTGLLFGVPRRSAESSLFNSALLIGGGRILLEQHKALLPDYDVFDESRYFVPASRHRVVDFAGHRLGICICEDAWNLPEFRPQGRYQQNPVEQLVKAGAEAIINLSASPFHQGKGQVRRQIAQSHARRHKTAFVLVNQVGANDELIFDGGSFVLRADGTLAGSLPEFEESLEVLELLEPAARRKPPKRSPKEAEGEAKEEIVRVRKALVLGTRDYFIKTGVKTALVGLSGGIDSSVVAAVAAEALGPTQVYGVTLPGPYSSTGSVNDSARLANNLGIHFETLPITDVFRCYLDVLDPLFQARPADLTEENIQARIRGGLLMALANKFGHLLLATSNKSEMAVGYATLYGDMTGALAVIADLFKGQVYELAHDYNSECEIIPDAILTKPPSAELRLDQKDSDSLPAYDLLDAILKLYIEQRKSLDQIVAAGFDRAVAESVLALVHASEYKRWQAAPVLRITGKSFGTGRRLPLAAKYSG